MLENHDSSHTLQATLAKFPIASGLLDKELNLVYGNSALQQLFGKSNQLQFPIALLDLIGWQHQQLLEQHLADSSQQPLSLTTNIDHELHTLECYLSQEPCHGLWVLQCIDISHSRNDQHELKQAKLNIERLEFAARGANIGIWDFYPQQGRIMANQTWATQKKYPAASMFDSEELFAEVIDGLTRWSEMVHPDDLDQAVTKIKAHLNGETDCYQAEFRMRGGDGEWRWLLDLGKVSHRDEQGQPVRMNGIHLDIDNIKKLQQKLAKAKDQAEVANRAKSTFLANMSHELRTPLNAVLGFSKLMQDANQLDEENLNYINIINQSGEHLLALINDVLDMSKIEAGHYQLEKQVVNFYELVDDLYKLLSIRAKEKNISFTISRHPNVPQFVIADSVKLRQILLNLLGNAIKFTAQGSISLQLDYASPCSSKSLLIIKVQDTGCGIASADLERIFLPFEQLEQVSKAKGTGLGLSITKQFIELMQGDIRVSSELNTGSEFWVTIPITVADKASQDIELLSKGIKLHPQNGDVKILVAEDEVFNQKLIIKILNGAGFQTQLATNGEQAVALYQQWQPDLIFMDRRMPVLDGLAATRQIRALGAKAKKVKIIALTASVFKDEKHEMLLAGMDDFLCKPYRPNQLFQCLKHHLKLEFNYNHEPPLPQVETPALSLDFATMVNQIELEFLVQLVEAVKEGEQDQLLELVAGDALPTALKTHFLMLIESYNFAELNQILSTNTNHSI